MRDYVRECIEKRINELVQYREKYFREHNIDFDTITNNEESWLDWVHSAECDELSDLLDFISEHYGDENE